MYPDCTRASPRTLYNQARVNAVLCAQEYFVITRFAGPSGSLHASKRGRDVDLIVNRARKCYSRVSKKKRFSERPALALADCNNPSTRTDIRTLPWREFFRESFRFSYNMCTKGPFSIRAFHTQRSLSRSLSRWNRVSIKVAMVKLNHTRRTNRWDLDEDAYATWIRYPSRCRRVPLWC